MSALSVWFNLTIYGDPYRWWQKDFKKESLPACKWTCMGRAAVADRSVQEEKSWLQILGDAVDDNSEKALFIYKRTNWTKEKKDFAPGWRKHWFLGGRKNTYWTQLNRPNWTKQNNERASEWVTRQFRHSIYRGLHPAPALWLLNLLSCWGDKSTWFGLDSWNY